MINQTRMQVLKQELKEQKKLAQKGRMLQSALRAAKIGKEKQKEKERNIEIFGTPFIIGKTVVTSRSLTGQRVVGEKVPKGEKGILRAIYPDIINNNIVIVKFRTYGNWYIWGPSLKKLHILEDDSETWWQKKYKNFSVIKQKSDEFRLLSIEKKKNKLLWDKKNKAIGIEVKSKNWKEFLKGKNTQKIMKIYQKRIDKLTKENTDMKKKNRIISKSKMYYYRKLQKLRNHVLSGPYPGRMNDIRQTIYMN